MFDHSLDDMHVKPNAVLCSCNVHVVEQQALVPQDAGMVHEESTSFFRVVVPIDASSWGPAVSRVLFRISERTCTCVDVPTKRTKPSDVGGGLVGYGVASACDFDFRTTRGANLNISDMSLSCEIISSTTAATWLSCRAHSHYLVLTRVFHALLGVVTQHRGAYIERRKAVRRAEGHFF